MPNVFDPATGQFVPASPEEAAAGILAGKLGVDSSAGPVLVQKKDGEVAEVKPEELAGLLQSGAKLLGSEEEAQELTNRKEESKGILGSIASGAESFANQALLGVPNAIRSGLQTKEEQAEQERADKYHAAARILGGAAGFGASVLYGGELLRGADLAAKAVAEGIVPAAKLANAGLAAQLASKGVEYATQGALLASPQALVEASFGDPQQAAETLSWGVGAGAILGGVAGAIGAAGRGVKGAIADKLLAPEVEARVLQADLTSKSALDESKVLVDVPIDRITHNKDVWSEEKLADAKARLASGSLMPPIRIDRAFEGDGFTIQDGIHRTAAAREAGYTHVPALVDPDIADELEAAGGSGRKFKPEIAGELSDWADRQGLKSLGLSSRRAGQYKGQTLKDLGSALHDNGLIQPNDTREMLGERVEALRKTVGQEMEDHINLLDAAIEGVPKEKRAAVNKAMPRRAGLATAIADGLNSPQMKLGLAPEQVRAKNAIIQAVGKLKADLSGRVSFETAQKFASTLYDKYGPSIRNAQQAGGVRGPEAVTEADRVRALAYKIVRNYVDERANAVAIAGGKPELVGKLAALKVKYSQLKNLQKFAADLDLNHTVELFKDASHAIRSGSGHGALGHGFLRGGPSAVGAGLGAMIAGVPGAIAGSVIGRVPAVALDLFARRWIENEGLIKLSSVVKKASKDGPEAFAAALGADARARLDATLKTSHDVVHRLATVGTSRFAQENPLRHMLDTTGLGHDAAYSRVVDRLDAVAGNPQALAEAVSDLSAPIQHTAPAVADAYRAQLVKQLTYLQQSVPRAPPPKPFTPEQWNPSAIQKQSFHDKVEIVGNPARALAHVESGTLSKSHLEALATVYPQTFEKMRQAIAEYGANHPDLRLPERERSSVARFLGQDLGGLTSANAGQILQSAYQGQKSAQQKPGGNGESRGNPKRDIRKMPSLESAFGASGSKLGE